MISSTTILFLSFALLLAGTNADSAMDAVKQALKEECEENDMAKPKTGYRFVYFTDGKCYFAKIAYNVGEKTSSYLKEHYCQKEFKRHLPHFQTGNYVMIKSREFDFNIFTLLGKKNYFVDAGLVKGAEKPYTRASYQWKDGTPIGAWLPWWQSGGKDYYGSEPCMVVAKQDGKWKMTTAACNYIFGRPMCQFSPTEVCASKSLPEGLELDPPNKNLLFPKDTALQVKCAEGHGWPVEPADKTVTCGEGGIWKGQDPCPKMCKASDLKQVELPVGVKLAESEVSKDEFPAGGNVNAECVEDYGWATTPSPMVVTCGDAGEWTHSMVACPKKCKSEDLRPLPDGVRFETTPGSTTSFGLGHQLPTRCDDNHAWPVEKTRVETMVTCGNDGIWKHNLEACPLKCNPVDFPLLDYGVESVGPLESVPLGSKFNATCAEGHDWPDEVKKKEPAVKCGEGGCFASDLPSGVKIKEEAEGKISSSLHDESVTIECEENHEWPVPPNTETVKCNNGTWESRDIPVCPAKCFFNTLPANTEQKKKEGSSVHNDTKEVQCKANHSWSDGAVEINMTCDNGTWLPERPACRPTCQSLPSKLPEGVELAEKHYKDFLPIPHGRYLYTRCRPGYARKEFQVKTTVWCDKGHWIHEIRECHRSCKLPSHVRPKDHSIKDISHFVSDPDRKLSVVCKGDRKWADGDTEKEVNCAHGEWKPELKDCQLACDIPPSINNSNYEQPKSTKQPSSTRLKATCQKNHTISPNGQKQQSIKCKAGEWKSETAAKTVPCQKDCFVSTLPDHVKSAQPPTQFHSGEKTVVRCADGYKWKRKPMVKYKWVNCQDGEWQWNNGKRLREPCIYHSCGGWKAGAIITWSLLAIAFIVGVVAGIWRLCVWCKNRPRPPPPAPEPEEKSTYQSPKIPSKKGKKVQQEEEKSISEKSTILLGGGPERTIRMLAEADDTERPIIKKKPTPKKVTKKKPAKKTDTKSDKDESSSDSDDSSESDSDSTSDNKKQ